VDHGLVDGLDAVADGELVDDLLGGLVEVDLPGVVLLVRNGKRLILFRVFL
jgi:hypothetical protein